MICELHLNEIDCKRRIGCQWGKIRAMYINEEAVAIVPVGDGGGLNQGNLVTVSITSRPGQATVNLSSILVPCVNLHH